MVPAVVMPRTVVLPIAYGWTVTAWEELTHKQYNELRRRVHAESPTGALRPDPTRFQDGLVVTYLVDWTLTDAQGARIEIRGLAPDAVLEVLGNLRQFAALEVSRAIEAHHERVAAVIDDLKKTASPAAPSPTTSPFAGSPA
jgi:hypothetical protein